MFDTNTRLGASGISDPYIIERSLIFDGDRSTGANQTAPMEWYFTSDGNKKTMTFSAWIRRGQIDKEQYVIQAANTDYPNVNGLRFRTDNKLQFHAGNSYADCNYVTNRKFQDEAAWYHIVFAVDTTQATDTNRFKLYVNGVQETDFSTNTKFDQNDDLWLMSTKKHTLGCQSEQGYEYWRMFDGEMADVHFLDGVQLTASSFGEEDTNGTWVPKEYDTADGSYGTNGFFLKFSDVTRPDDIGKDYAHGKLADAGTNALPILNTTGDYGETVGSGNRTDSLSSNLKLALAMNSTTNLTTDLSGNGHNMTNSGGGSNSGFNAGTASSKFYGTSMLSDSDDNMLQTTTATADLAAGTGDFCYEFWFRFEYVYAANGNICNIFDTRHTGMSTANNCVSAWWEYATDYIKFYVAGTNYNIKQWAQRGKWYHGAITRSSGTVACYLDGKYITGGSNTGDLTSEKITIGKYYGADRAWSGGLQDFRFYKGAAKYTGTSNFTTPASNDAEVHGLTAVDSTDPENVDIVRDTPNLRHPCLSFAQTRGASNYVSRCGTAIDFTTGNDNYASYITHYMKTGKWYFEVKFTSAPTAMTVGASPDDYYNGKRCQNRTTWGAGFESGSGICVQCGYDQHYIAGANQGSYMGGGSNGDRLMVALDCDNGKIYFGRNGQWADGSGNADESGLINDAALTIGGTAPYGLSIGDSSGSYPVNAILNCGQWPFKHNIPTGYSILNTDNIPDPTIITSESYVKALTYTGNATSRNLVSGFATDFVWIKRTSGSESHVLANKVIGADNFQMSDLNSTQNTANNCVTAFNSDGVTVGSQGIVNDNNEDMLSVHWKESASAGFDIVSYTGNGAANNVSHSLGVAPDLIIFKKRSEAYNWMVYTKLIDGSLDYLHLNTNNAKIDSGWTTLVDSSTVIQLEGNSDAVNDDGETYIAYLFSGVEGYSKLGMYTGNGSTDGPFINCGFKPAVLIVKATNRVEDWQLWNNASDPDNLMHNRIFPSNSDAATTSVNSASSQLDFYSNGFKWKGQSNDTNGDGDTYLFMAFAETPFKYANAR